MPPPSFDGGQIDAGGSQSEELRHLFVAHEGQKHLTVSTLGTRYTVDFGDMAKQMTAQIHANVVDESLVDWVLPRFSTTEDNDVNVRFVTLETTPRPDVKRYGSLVDSRCRQLADIVSITIDFEAR